MDSFQGHLQFSGAEFVRAALEKHSDEILVLMYYTNQRQNMIKFTVNRRYSRKVSVLTATPQSWQ